MYWETDCGTMEIGIVVIWTKDGRVIKAVEWDAWELELGGRSGGCGWEREVLDLEEVEFELDVAMRGWKKAMRWVWLIKRC